MTKLDVLNKKLKLSGDKKLVSTALGAMIMQTFYGFAADKPVTTKETPKEE